MDFNLLIQRRRERFQQLEREIADPRLFCKSCFSALINMREHSSVGSKIARRLGELETARRQLQDNRGTRCRDRRGPGANGAGRNSTFEKTCARS